MAWGSTLTQTVGAAVLKFTIAKWFVFSISISWGGKEVSCNGSKAVPLTSAPTQGTVLRACYSTSSMSPRCPWISWDKSRSRVTGLLYKIWRLKSKFIKPLQNEASSRVGRKDEKVSYNLVGPSG